MLIKLRRREMVPTRRVGAPTGTSGVGVQGGARTRRRGSNRGGLTCSKAQSFLRWKTSSRARCFNRPNLPAKTGSRLSWPARRLADKTCCTFPLFTALSSLIHTTCDLMNLLRLLEVGSVHKLAKADIAKPSVPTRLGSSAFSLPGSSRVPITVFSAVSGQRMWESGAAERFRGRDTLSDTSRRTRAAIPLNDRVGNKGARAALLVHLFASVDA